MKDDIELGNSSVGIGVRSTKSGITLHFWYDSGIVGSDFMHISWENLDEIRERGKRRKAMINE